MLADPRAASFYIDRTDKGYASDYAAVEGHGLLSPIRTKPVHIIVNLLPVYAGEPFVTLNTIGVVFCPYHVFNKAEMVASMSALGYECVDIWKNEEKRCTIPFYPDHSLDAYHGFYFRLSA